MSESLQSLRGRIGAYAQHAKHSTKETTAAAHAAFLDRFEHQVDPEGILPADERARRANAALRAHMARLALASAKVRSAKAARRKAGA